MLLKLTTVAVVFFVWVPVASAWSWPVRGPVLQPFSYDEAHPYDAGQHRGIDIGGATSVDVVAPESGVVSFAGFVPTSGDSLTIETADGYSVTLTHLGSIRVAVGAAVGEGDTVASVGSSGAPEQSVPYVHLGIRLTDDPLGYLDPLGLLPAPAPPPPTPPPTPAPAPQPVPQTAPANGHGHGGGLVVQAPGAAPPAAVAPAEPAHMAKPGAKPHSQPSRKPAVHTVRPGVPAFRLPLAEPLRRTVPIVAGPVAPTIEPVPLTLSLAPCVVAVLLALVTAFSRRRPTPADVIAFPPGRALREAA